MERSLPEPHQDTEDVVPRLARPSPAVGDLAEYGSVRFRITSATSYFADLEVASSRTLRDTSEHRRRWRARLKVSELRWIASRGAWHICPDARALNLREVATP